MHTKLRKKFYLLILWSALLDILLLMPMPTGGDAGPLYIDKVVHFFLFGILSFLIALFLKEFRSQGSLKKILTISFLIAVAYASLMEIVQSYVPSRTKSIYDFFFGFLGVVVFLIIFYVKDKRKG